VRLLGVRASGLAAASVYRQAPLFRYPGR
jgi:hypothetical protein